MTKSKKILNIFTAVIVGLFLACTIASFAIRAATQPKVRTVQGTEYYIKIGSEWFPLLTVPREALQSETRSFTDEEGTEYTWEQYYVYVATSSLGLFGEVFDAERINVNMFPIEEYLPEDYRPEDGMNIHIGDERINLDDEEAVAYGWSPFTVDDSLALLSEGSLTYWHKIIVTELDRIEEGTRVRMMPPDKAEETLTLSASSGSSSSEKSVQDSGTDTASGDAPAAGTGPESVWAEMPEATSSLTVYAYWVQSTAAKMAIEIFEEKYPDVKIDYQTLGEDEYTERLRAEIPAGRGPDIVFGDSALLPDIYKTMSTGVFTDLAPYMENDPEYDPADYYEGVMKGGVMNGKQYLLPLTFDMNIYVTSEELLAKNGIDPASLNTWEGFLGACETFHEANPGKPLFSWNYNRYYINDLLICSGFRMIDYENDRVSFDETHFRQIFELIRLYCYPKQPEDLQFGDDAKSLKQNKCLFGSTAASSPVLAMSHCAWANTSIKQTPVFVTVPDENGGTSAEIDIFVSVPESSKNKLNAWRFIKILLSPALHGWLDADGFPDDAFPVGCSVRRDSLRLVTEGQIRLTPCTSEDVEKYLAVADTVTDAVMLPRVIWKYVNEAMIPYITSKDGSNYGKQFEKLISTLEIYKDE